MNKIFKTKYDVTTGQTKVVSELANNRQVASRVEGSSVAEKCGVFLGNFLGAFKVLPLALVMSGVFSSIGYGATVFLDNNKTSSIGSDNKSTAVWSDEGVGKFNNTLKDKLKKSESILLSHIDNTAGADTSLTNKDFFRTVVIGSRTVAGGNDATAIGYRAIVGKNKKETNTKDSHQGTAVGYRAFANGTESVSMGNDTIAWGDSSIAIGSDNANGKEAKNLSKEIYKLFHALRDDFNYTSEYAAVNHKTLRQGKEKSHDMLDNDGNLMAKDGFYIGYNGGYYFREPDESGQLKNENLKYMLKDGILYEKIDQQGFSKIENKKRHDEIMNSLKNNEDYKRYEQYMAILDADYQNYKVTPNSKKTHTWARGNNSIAIGGRSIAFGNNSTALGTASVAARDYATAIGSDTIAYGKQSLAVGNRAIVYSDGSVGIGHKVQALNAGAMVYGRESFAGGTGSLAIGDRTFANVTMGDDFKTTVEDLYLKGDTDTIQNSHKEKFYPKTVLQDGTEENKAEQSRDSEGRYNQGAVALGSYATALGDNTLALGRFAYAKEDSAVALGRFAFARNKESLALAPFSRAMGERSVALGHQSLVEAKDSMAIGVGARVSGEIPEELKAATNKNIKVPNEDSMAIGNKAEAYFPKSIALGVESKTDYSRKEMAQDAWAPKHAISLPSSQKIGYLSVGGKNAERRIVNVAPGASDTDAVNVSQLRALEEAILYGSSLEEEEAYNGVKYLSIKGIDEYKKIVRKEQDYKNYLKVKKEYLKLKARRDVNNEEINLTNIESKVTAYESKYGDFANTSNKLTEEKNKEYKILLTEDVKNNPEKEKERRKNYLKIKYEEIEDAYEKDIAQDKIDNLLTEEQKTKFKNSNFLSDGAKASGSMAMGVGALTNSVESIVIGRNAMIENKAANNTVLLGNNTSSDTANAVALGNFSVADRKPEPASKLDATGRSNAYISDDLANLIDEHHAYAAVSVGRYGGDLKDLTNNVQTEKDYDKWLKDNKHRTKEPAYEQERLAETAKIKKFALRKITNVAPGTKDTDVVILAQLKEAMKGVGPATHYVSVKGTDQSDDSNYKNDGAKGTDSVAIGVSAATDKSATAGIAIGKGAKSEAENAVAIGNGASIDVPNSFVMGSNNIVNQSNKETRGAVVVIGSGIKLDESKSSIAIGAVYLEGRDGEKDGTVIENAAWTASIGNKNKIKNGTDIIAVGNNIKIQGDLTAEEESKYAERIRQRPRQKTKIESEKTDTIKNFNTEVVAIGNGADAIRAKNSVLIGAKTKAESNATQAVIIGYEATAKENAVGAVVIGQGASVETLAGDSIALGQGSKATKKETAPSKATSSKNVNFTWTAGIGNNTSVVSLGDTSKERQIKHVAAGEVTKASTDAINGSQLYAVADEFSKLAVDVLGAEADTTSGFKKSTFNQLIGANGSPAAATPATAKTFKQAIDDNIAKINEGFKFGDGNTDGTHYLGSTLNIKAGNIDSGAFTSDNIKTHYETNNKNILIGIKKAPSFEKVTVTQDVTDNSDKMVLTTKNYVDTKFNSAGSTLKFTADNGNTQTLAKNGTLQVKGTSGEITTTASNNDTVTIALDQTLKGKINTAATTAATAAQKAEAATTKADANAQAIATVTDTANQNKTTISAVKATADQNKTDIASAKSDIAENKQSIATVTETANQNKGDISALKSQTETNTQAIAQKEDKLTKGNITAKADGLVEVTGGTDAVIGSGVTIGLNEATKTKLSSIGSGAIGDTTTTNSDKTVTGQTVYNYLQNFSQTLTLSTDGTADSGSVNLKNGKLHVTGSDGVGVDISGSKITVKLDDTTKGKINNALSGSDADGKYAKIDGSNITKSSWRTKLDVYTKSETNSAVEKAKETVTNGTGIKVDSSDSTNGGKQFTVSLDSDTQTKLGNIGTGEVTANNDKTVTGGKVHTAIETAKTTLNAAINGKATKSLDNIDSSGKTVIKNLTKVKHGKNVTVDSSIEGDAQVFTINAVDTSAKVTAESGSKIHVTTTEGTEGNTTVKEFKLDLTEETKTKIDNALSASDAATNYAKVDASNITDGSAWRTKLDVYSKAETTTEINKAKETVASGDGITVTSTNGDAKTFTVALSQETRTKLNNIGTGKVEASNAHTVTGGTVHTAIEKAKNALKGELANTATFGLQGNDSQDVVTKTLNNTLKITGSESAKADKTNIYVSKNASNDGLNIELGENLAGIKKISNGDTEITIDTDGVKIKSGKDGAESKITLSADHILSDKDIYVGPKDDKGSNKLVKQSDVDGLSITFEDENSSTESQSNGTQNVKVGKKVIYGKSSEITPTVSASGDDAKVTFSINDKSISESKLEDTLKGKIDKIATNESGISNLSAHKLTFKDGGTSSFERANNTSKNVVFKGTGNLNVKLATETNNDTGTFTISVNETDSINEKAGTDKPDTEPKGKHENKLTTEKAVVDYVQGKISAIQTNLDNTIGTGTIDDADTNQKTVTGQTVKTYVDGKTFKLAGNDSDAVSSQLDGTIHIKGSNKTYQASGDTEKSNIYVSKVTETAQGADPKEYLQIQLADALTGIKTIELKDDKGSRSKTIAINNKGDLVVRREINENNQPKSVENEIITSENIGDQTITYKSNGSNKNGKTDKEFTVKLSEGLDFTKTDNIAVEVSDNGVVKHTLVNNLTQIDSISSGKDAKGAKISFTSDTDTTADPANNDVKNKIEFTIGTQSTSTQGQDSATVTSTTFSFSEKGLDLGSKQIKNVASGISQNASSDVGDATSNVSDVLTGTSIENIKNNAVNVKDLSDVAKAIIDKGLTFKGTELKDDKTQQQATISLGSTIEIDSSESKNSKASDGKDAPKEKDIKVSVGANKITLALNKSEALSLEDERVVTSKAVKTALDDMQSEINNKISKTDANNPFETTYKDKDGKELEKHGDNFYKKDEIPDGAKYNADKGKFTDKDGRELPQQPTAIAKNEVKEEINLKGDTPKKIANVDSGLGLEKYQEPNTDNLDDEAKNKEIAKAKENHQKAKKDAIDKLLGNNADKANNIKDSDPMLNNVATIRDLQALGQAGLDFAGNDATSVHRNLGQKLVIKGDQDAPAGSFESAKDNINVAVEGEALVVQLSKNLKNLTSAEFTSEETKDGTKQTFKTTINGKSIALEGKDGTTTNMSSDKITLKDKDGNTADMTGNEIALKGKDGKPTIAKLNQDGLTVGDKDATNGDKTHAVYGKDGLTVHGKDGKSAVSLKMKMSEKNGKSVPTLEFAKGADDKGTGVITGLADLTKDSDGTSVANKNYVDTQLTAAKAEADKTAMKYDDENKTSITLGGKPQAGGTAPSPVMIDNLKSGLGIDDIQSGGVASIKQGKQGELVKQLVAGELDTTKDASGKAKDNLHKAVNLADLKAVAQAGLNFAGNDGQDIHKNLSEKLEIVGQGLDKDKVTAFKGTNGNIAVKTDNGKLSISLNEALTGLKSAEFISEETNSDGTTQKTKTTINGKGTTIVELDKEGNTKENGKSASYTLDKVELKDGNKSNTSTAEGNAIVNGDKIHTSTAESDLLLDKATGDSNTRTATANVIADKAGNQSVLDKDGLTVGDKDATNGDKTHAVYGKDGFTVKGKDGSTEAISLKVTEKDGKETATLAFGKGTDGKGTGVITGLADLTKDSDGTSVANKNYVDEKVESINDKLKNNLGLKEIDNPDYVKAEEDLAKAKEALEKENNLAKKAELQKAVTDAEAKVNELSKNKKLIVTPDGRDGKSYLEAGAAATHGPTDKDGLNGKNATEKVNALRNGEAGAVVFTDKDGNRLVKANDGEYYKADNVNADGTVKIATDGKDKPKPVEKPQLSLVNHEGNTTTPTVLGNVASGLDINAEKVKQAEKEVKAKRSEAERKATMLKAKAALVEQKEAEITALKQEIENLSGDEKTQKEAELKAIEAELSQFNDELATATKDLKTANDALKTANDELTNFTENRIGNLVKGENINPTNGANIGDLQAVARAGLNFEGNDGVPVHKNLGEKLTIKGEGTFNSDSTAAGNIKVEMAQDGKGLEVKLSDQLKNMTSFETREVDGKKSRLDSNGLQASSPDSETFVNAQGTRITGKGNHAGQSASYTLDGIKLQGKAGEPSLMATHAGLMVSGNNGNIVINGNRGEILIPDVKPDASGFVAINKNYVDARNHELRTQIHHADRRLRAGIAGANAAAALASVSMPGKSMVAIAAAGHDGESALAIGYSRISDNGKVMLKLQGNSNSQGKVSGAVSVGYQW
uniref:Autotransporter adhesin n=1 Tax=Histophilus somni (strain 129Pt) TaxID=205914 RepID=Q0I2H0_HISS1